MRVLYIGHYRDGTGWGNAAVNNILAMDAAGIEVVPRAITYEASDKDYPDKIKELEQQSKDGCDVVVQHTLPSNYWYDNNYKNIGFLAVESSNFKSTGWHRHCNFMDEIWVPSNVTKQQVINTGVKVPVQVVPHSLDMTQYKDTRGQKVQELNNNFTFGFIGECIERKNIKALVQAFHLEFHPREPVNLFIKTSKKDVTHVQNYFKHIKNGLKVRDNYKEEIIICGMMPQDDYISVLSQIDCFVMPSRGEAFCIPSLEATAMGIPSIFTEGIGMEHVSGVSRPVKSHPTPCFGAIETLSNLDTGDADWLEIDIRDLAKNMREAYNFLSIEQNKEKTQLQLKERAMEYSHESIGNIIKEILNDR